MEQVDHLRPTDIERGVAVMDRLYDCWKRGATAAQAIAEVDTMRPTNTANEAYWAGIADDAPDSDDPMMGVCFDCYRCAPVTGIERRCVAPGPVTNPTCWSAVTWRNLHCPLQASAPARLGLAQSKDGELASRQQ